METTMDAMGGTKPALSGLLAAALALAASELVAGVTGVPSLIVTVGNLVVDTAPPALEDFAIGTFGVYDKVALFVGMLVVAGVAGAVLGMVAARTFVIGVAGFLAFGLLAVLAALRDPQTPVAPALAAALVAAGVGIGALAFLLRAAVPGPDPAEIRASRRAFLQGVAGVAAVAAVAAATGRFLVEQGRAIVRGREEVVLPEASEPAPGTPDEASLEVEGLDPLITPNQDFYRIDTALVVPRVDVEGWNLEVTGMVDQPYRLTFDELLAMPMVEHYVTLACVSNEVGGHLVGNALWLGVPLRDVLGRAGVQAGATQIVGRAVDGFTVGFPTEAAFDGRVALVAVGMNGEPLPYAHGFPARLVVSGLYGYVSATKWLEQIELTTLEAFDAYWIPRGWAKQAPIKTQSRIDVPGFGSSLRAGPQRVAGVAWAPNRGIERVEVQVDESSWQEATLSRPLSGDAWVQWVFEWQAPAGDHVLRVRATDGTGQTQPEERVPPRPDGATGYHTISVEVR
jgi:DMSO/TMAO reductase YedYZ molybdopterin-dependent catalytic subunit